MTTSPPPRIEVRPQVHGYFHDDTNSISYVIQDPDSNACAIVDPVLDFDAASGRTATVTADRLAEHVSRNALEVVWILETHVHADHLSAAQHLRSTLGGAIAIGAEVTRVQKVFGQLFNESAEFHRDGRQFDRLLHDGDTVVIGGLQGTVMHTPGHTPACLTYVFGDAAFVGDTLFMPDYGTARCDFPGGDAATLYRSIQRVLALPDATRMFLCHDYKAPGRDVFVWETTVAKQRSENVHVHEGVSEQEFVAMRTARDATLSMPHLILPSVQVNMRAGDLPPAETNGIRYLKIPLDTL